MPFSRRYQCGPVSVSGLRLLGRQDSDRQVSARRLAVATTESASIGMAGEALQGLGLGVDKVKAPEANIGVTYAITCLFGMLNEIFFASRVTQRLLGIDLKREAQKLENALGGSGIKLAPGQFEAFGVLRFRVYQVTTEEAVVMTVSDLEERFNVRVEKPHILCQSLERHHGCGHQD